VKANIRSVLLLAAVAVISTAQVRANDADGQRDISPYDSNPACLDRGQLQPGQANPCVLPSPPSGRFPIVRAPAAASSASGGIAQGGQQGLRSGSTVSSASAANAGQVSGGGTGTTGSSSGARVR